MGSMGETQLDETSCGPLCQHPQCWASNRRVERGLPRLDTFPEKNILKDHDTESLPTLKIQNMLDEYGLSNDDNYPSIHHVAISSLGANSTNYHRRSTSAPSAFFGKSSYPEAPFQTPKSGGRGEAPRRSRNRSRSALLEPIEGAYPPKMSNVYLNQLIGSVEPSSEVYMDSRVYLWKPSAKAAQKKQEKLLSQSKSSPDIKEPRLVSPRDITESLLPATIGQTQQSTKKMKNKRSNKTPTGGRPYTHPSKSPPPSTRRTLPADVDEGIAQLLSLPRDVMLEILEHTKESDLFDKEKVQKLLAKVMPHIHFQSDQSIPPTAAASDHELKSPPLHAMGLLRNQKMPILEGKQKFEKTDLHRTFPIMPLFLDDGLMSGITTSTYSYQGGGDEGNQQQIFDEDGRSLMQPTTASEGLSRRKNRQGTMADVGHLFRGKITSVSAKSLPPITPGTKTTKPFDYTAQSLDLALTPLPTPENPTPEEPSTPRSGKASTLYVTVPSELSDDRTITPMTTAKHPHLAILRQESPFARSVTSSHPSDEFVSLSSIVIIVMIISSLSVGVSNCGTLDPSRLISPVYSTSVPKAPYGTPATGPQNSFGRENTLLSTKTSTSYDSRGLEDLTTRKSSGSTSGRVRVSSAEQGLHTIHEHLIDNPANDVSTPDTITAHPASVSSATVKPPRSVSPWETANAGSQLVRGKTPPPVRNTATPTLSNPSPDIWPVVDERSYLHSPEPVEPVISTKKKDIPETVAPPPSPEPRAVSTELRVLATPESRVEAAAASDVEELKCTGIPLAPLREEEEDDKVSTEGLMIERVMEVNQLEMRSDTSRTPDVGDELEGSKLSNQEEEGSRLETVSEEPSIAMPSSPPKHALRKLSDIQESEVDINETEGAIKHVEEKLKLRVDAAEKDVDDKGADQPMLDSVICDDSQDNSTTLERQEEGLTNKQAEEFSSEEKQDEITEDNRHVTEVNEVSVNIDKLTMDEEQSEKEADSLCEERELDK
ncbi:hypothetical protein HOLleu_17120 [Holothuria leucospilota]|uniref:Uncharacterized protein n=1 Tax=Holothuria leucospilota TaxID=206669 RepID=A0A9Q1C756_HOLLE|nr:hypothetical protein HOLleu_17120 [Holothuria leucospilota]